MGNFYGVLQVFDVDSVSVNEFGLKLEVYFCFLNKVNIGFCQVVDWQNICLCVYEWGVGEICVCGIGVCVVVVVLIVVNFVDNNVIVSLLGGEL